MTQALEVMPFPLAERRWAAVEDLLGPVYVLGQPLALGQGDAIKIEVALCLPEGLVRLPVSYGFGLLRLLGALALAHLVQPFRGYPPEAEEADEEDQADQCGDCRPPFGPLDPPLPQTDRP